jgi:hypothetical protein
MWIMERVLKLLPMASDEIWRLVGHEVLRVVDMELECSLILLYYPALSRTSRCWGAAEASDDVLACLHRFPLNDGTSLVMCIHRSLFPLNNYTRSKRTLRHFLLVLILIALLRRSYWRFQLFKITVRLRIPIILVYLYMSTDIIGPCTSQIGIDGFDILILRAQGPMMIVVTISNLTWRRLLILLLVNQLLF